METSCASLRTPAGTIYVRGTGNVITEIGFGDIRADENITPVVRKAIEQLTEYIEGKRKEFELPLTVTGSELQMDVCNALIEIPYGETRTYKDIAKDAGHPKAIRAVATAIGKNPIAVMIPCHRVIGSDGKMHGFGGGIPFKEYLLGVEGWNPPKR